ncbi:MAG TPA: hypothetical protein VGZ22_25785 [Isosphaeraceae bacterium]|nr:hypothetical protein [Isosphaeraceae bacterium]
MNDESASIAEITQQLRHLARQCRRLKWVCAALGVTTFAMLAAGAYRGEPETITAREFVLVNAKGKVIAILGSEPNSGSLYLHFFDPEPGGVARLALSNESLMFMGKVRQGISTRVELGWMPGNHAALAIRDDHGVYRTELGVSAENWTYFNFKDRNGVARFSYYPQGDDDAPQIYFSDAHDNDRAILGLELDGSPALKMSKLNSEASLMLGGSQGGPAGLFLSDKNGRDRILMQVGADGASLLKVNDKSGKTLLQSPGP